MSFILDALRKSEHERQRQTGPALAELPVAPAKPRSNLWAPVVVALLLVNLAVVGVFLIRKAREAGPAASAPAASTAMPPQQKVPAPATAPAPPRQAVPATTMAPAPAAVAPSRQAPSLAGPAARSIAPPPPPVLSQAATGANRNSLAEEASTAPPTLDPRMAAAAAAAPPGPPAVMRAAPVKPGSVIYESLPDSAALGGGAQSSSQRPAQAASARANALPPVDELYATGAVQPLNLDLHVWSTKPSERMVFINSHKYHEGDSIQDGLVVSEITSGGVVLDYRGRSYMLSRQ
jgi:general secretion pathway protein B